MLFTIEYLDVWSWYTIDHSPVFNSLFVLLSCSSFPRIYYKSIHIIHQSPVLDESRSPFFRGSGEGTDSLQNMKIRLPTEMLPRKSSIKTVLSCWLRFNSCEKTKFQTITKWIVVFSYLAYGALFSTQLVDGYHWYPNNGRESHQPTKSISPTRKVVIITIMSRRVINPSE